MGANDLKMPRNDKNNAIIISALPIMLKMWSRGQNVGAMCHFLPLPLPNRTAIIVLLAHANKISHPIHYADDQLL